jgi:hypothetical protein
VLGIGAAIGSAFVWEKLVDTSLHSAQELEALTKFPVRVTIPRLPVSREPYQGFRKVAYLVALALLLFVVSSVVRRVATNNAQLAMKFSSRLISASK